MYNLMIILNFTYHIVIHAEWGKKIPNIVRKETYIERKLYLMQRREILEKSKHHCNENQKKKLKKFEKNWKKNE